MGRTRGTLLAILCLAAAGCKAGLPAGQVLEIANSPIPRELNMVSLPEYRVAPPDVLLVEAVDNIRRPEAPIEAGDELVIRAANTLPLDPGVDPAQSPIEFEIGMQLEQSFKVINGVYVVQPDGTVDLGPVYGKVVVAGLTPIEAQAAIQRYLRERPDAPQERLPEAVVSVSMPDLTADQVISGEHLVRPDGTISLGIYGSVYVAGMTLEEIRFAVETHLEQFVHDPDVKVDVVQYASKVVYVIIDGGGAGERVLRLYVQGNETVLDALANETVQGISEISSKRIWVARPGPPGTDVAKIMPVDWRAIAEKGITTTNYQLFPGDRIYIEADHFIAFDTAVAKITAPFERMFGFVLLGNGMVRSLQGKGGGFGGGFGGFGNF